MESGNHEHDQDLVTYNHYAGTLYPAADPIRKDMAQAIKQTVIFGMVGTIADAESAKGSQERQFLPFNKKGGGSSYVPLLTLGNISKEEFPIPLQQLAENIVDILGGHAPRHELGLGHKRFYYSRAGANIILKTQDEGVAVPAIVIAANQSDSMGAVSLSLLERLDTLFMKKFGDSFISDRPSAHLGLPLPPSSSGGQRPQL